MNSTTTIVTSENTIKLYKYRWLIVILFGLVNGVTSFQHIQFTIIANIIQDFYGVESMLVYMTGMLYFIAYLLLFIPQGYLVETFNLRTLTMTSISLTTLGNWLKTLATSPTPAAFHLILFGQALCAIARNILCVLPSKVAITWFGAKEVSTACSIIMFLADLGYAFSSVASTTIVKPNKYKEIVKENIGSLFTYNVSASVIILILVGLFFRSEPVSPPSLAQALRHSKSQSQINSYYGSIKKVLKNKDFIILTCVYGVGAAVILGMDTMINKTYTSYFTDDNNSHLGFIYSIGVLTACVGYVIAGVILDRTNKFKLLYLLYILGFSISLGLQYYFLQARNKLGVSINQAIQGLFTSGFMVASIEYSAEATYPIPDAVGPSILIFFSHFLTIILVSILSFIAEEGNFSTIFIIVVCLSISLIIPTLLISTELKRKRANIYRL